MEAPTASPPDAPVNAFEIVTEPPPLRDESLGGQKALRRYTPRTPGIRHLVRPVNDHLYKGRPVFNLTFPKKGQGRGGRNDTGRVTVRHRGGGHKRRIRIIDFDRHAAGQHVVERIEHDPGRSAHIALVKDKLTSDKSYIIAAEGLRAGDTVQSYRSGIPQELLDSMGGNIDQGVLASKTAWRGNCLPLGMIPVGTPIFNISLAKDGKALYCRSAGTHGFIIGKGEEIVRKELIRRMEAKVLSDKAKAVEREELEKAALKAEVEEKELRAKEAAERRNVQDAIAAERKVEEEFDARETAVAQDKPKTNSRGGLSGAEEPSNLAGKVVEGRRSDLIEERPNPDGAQEQTNSVSKDVESKPSDLTNERSDLSGTSEQTNLASKDVQDEPSDLIGDGLDLSADDARRLEKAAQYVTVRLSSGEVRLIDKEAVATVGVASNANHQYRQLGKAGRSRWLGIRPTVRGVAMNANDHPHGGGRGKGKGNRDPVSPWGIPVSYISGFSLGQDEQRLDLRSCIYTDFLPFPCFRFSTGYILFRH